MPFDPFRDFEQQGYLRNIYIEKNVETVRILEQRSFGKMSKVQLIF